MREFTKNQTKRKEELVEAGRDLQAKMRDFALAGENDQLRIEWTEIRKVAINYCTLLVADVKEEMLALSDAASCANFYQSLKKCHAELVTVAWIMHRNESAVFVAQLAECEHAYRATVKKLTPQKTFSFRRLGKSPSPPPPVREERPIHKFKIPAQKGMTVLEHIESERLIYPPGTLTGTSLVISGMRDTLLDIFCVIQSARIFRARECRIFIAAVTGSFLMEDCRNIELIIGCGQFRLTNCTLCDIRLSVTTRPIIDMSYNITIRAYRTRHSFTDSHWTDLDLNTSDEIFYKDVFDMTPLTDHTYRGPSYTIDVNPAYLFIELSKPDDAEWHVVHETMPFKKWETAGWYDPPIPLTENNESLDSELNKKI